MYKQRAIQRQQFYSGNHCANIDNFQNTIPSTCDVISYSVVANSSENNYHLSYQGSSLSFENGKDRGSTTSLEGYSSLDGGSLKSLWEPTRQTKEGNYVPYSMNPTSYHTTASRDIHNDSINSAEVMEKAYIQHYVLQSMRRCKGQTRGSVFAAEKVNLTADGILS